MGHVDEPRGAVVEIYERGGNPLPDVGPGSLLQPNEVRLNGVSLFCPADSPPVVERIGLGPDGEPLVRVNLTVWARRVVIDHIPDPPAEQLAAGGVVVVNLPEPGPYRRRP